MMSGKSNNELFTGTILLVDDADIVRAAYQLALEMEGYQVLEAGSGEEALAVSRQYAGPVHLLLTDIVMPGMNGRELAEQLAPLRPEMKALYMSGCSDATFLRDIGLKPDAPFLRKPFELDTLMQKVRQLLAVRGQ